MSEATEVLHDTAEMSALRERNARLLAQNATLAMNLGRMRRELEAWTRAPRGGDASAELARLTGALEAERREHEAELAELRAYAAQMEIAYLSAMRSTSWRLTAPLRAAIRRLRREPRPADFTPRYAGSE